MAYQMPQQAQLMGAITQLGAIGAQSAMGRQAKSQLLGEQMAYQAALQDRASASQNALYERQASREETAYQRRRQEGLDTYGQQFKERQAEFDRQQAMLSAREDKDYKRKKDDFDATSEEKRQAFNMEMEGAHKALVDYHNLILSARRPEDPDAQMSAKFLQGLSGAQGKNPYYVKGLIDMHMKNGINPFGLAQLGIASAKPAQPQPKAENRPKPKRTFSLNSPDDKYNM